jgi:hypothetical protein
LPFGKNRAAFRALILTFTFGQNCMSL